MWCFVRRFNVTGTCMADKHYMVDTKCKIDKIQNMVDDGLYFTINRARQYGKTTTIRYLVERLKSEYIVLNTSFEGVGEVVFENEKNFNKNFIDTITQILKYQKMDESIVNQWQEKEGFDTIKLLGDKIAILCETAPKPVIIIMDEVDKSCNHKLFLDFLGMLRAKYLTRDITPTFHSVILAGVHDIKTIRYSGSNQNSKNNNFDDNARKQDSPWNIAAKFDVDMSFNQMEISTMLVEYEKDHNTDMDIMGISNEIYIYTSGYPFLVSRICQIIEEELDKNWTINGVKEAVKLILREKNTLFDDMFKNFENYKDLYELVYSILVQGVEKNFEIDNPSIGFGATFGVLIDKNGKVAVANKIFEIRIYNYFISKDETSGNGRQITGVLAEDVIIEGKFNMELCLTKFAQHYYEMFNEKDVKFLEKHGRLLFLSYLKPLINGRGFYHIESETRNLRRMDIVIDYGTQQFILELKIWRGLDANQNAYEQLLNYMKIKNADTGYLLTFDFRKNKEQKIAWESINKKEIFDVIV